jgi:hypothetical protein
VLDCGVPGSWQFKSLSSLRLWDRLLA